LCLIFITRKNTIKMFSLNGDKMKKGNEVGRKRTPNKEELPTVRKKRRWGVVGVGRSPAKGQTS
jgi:hypothetical protein